MLAVGLVVGSTKGDDLLEVIQGVDSVNVDLESHKEIAASFNRRIHHQLSNTPDRLRGSNMNCEMVIMPDRYHFNFTVDEEKVAELDFDKEEKFIGGGWIVE